MEIDLLVIKKQWTVQVKNEIGRLFRGHNILEYKSPDDSLNIDTFYKAAAYVCLYKAYGETVDERRADDITVSLVRERRPDGLFQYFESHGIRVERPYRGIYYVLNAVQFPTQLIVTKELDMEGHIWLKSLSDNLDKQEIRKLLEQVEKLTQEVKKELADAVLEVSIQANYQTVEELREDEGMCQALLEIMEPEINRIVEEATKQSRLEAGQSRLEAERLRKEAKKEAIQTAKKMLESGKFSVEETQECVPRLSIKEIEAIAKELHEEQNIQKLPYQDTLPSMGVFMGMLAYAAFVFVVWSTYYPRITLQLFL